MEQARDGYSIGEQVARMRDYCKARGWTVYKVYTDPGYSGANMDRPGLQAMLEDAEDKKIDAVLVYKLDRLSRSQKDTLTIIEDYLLPNGVDFVSVTENLDTTSPFGKAMIGILSVFAELERSQIHERMDMGREARAKEGKWHGSAIPPVGYRYVDGELVVHEYEAMQVRELFRLYNMRIAPMRLQKMLNDKGYRTQYGEWNRKGLKPIISNRVYIGEVSFKGEWYPGDQEPIIERDVFDKAQAILTEHLDNHRRKPRYDSPIGGLVKCGWCGNNYYVRGGPPLKTGGHSRAFTCYKRTCFHGEWAKIPKEERCKNTNYRVDLLEEQVLGEIRRLALDPDGFEVEEKPDENSDKMRMIEARLCEIDAQLDRFLELFEAGVFDTQKVKAKADPLNDEKSSLKRELAKLHAAPKMSKTEAIEVALTIGDTIGTDNGDELRALVHELIDSIVIDGDKVHVYWMF